MKRIFILVLTLAMMLSFAACAGTPATTDTADESQQASEAASESVAVSESTKAETDTSWTDIEEKGSFTLGFDENFPPMGYKDESGTHVGFDIDMAAEVASRLGLELKLQPVDWDSKVLELNNGNIDLIWNGLSITEDYKKDMLFSEPYMNNRQIVIVLASLGITSIADLTGKTVAAQSGSSAMSAIEAMPEVKDTFGELVESPDYVEALMELKQGSVDAVVIDEIVGRYYISHDDAPDAYAVLEDNFGEEQYGVGFRMNDKAFRDKIQETIDAMIADGTAAEISQKWFGENIVIGE